MMSDQNHAGSASTATCSDGYYTYRSANTPDTHVCIEQSLAHGLRAITERNYLYFNRNNMKVTKHYENDLVMVFIEDGSIKNFITFESDRQMRRLGECLIDLERTGSREVIIEPKE